MLATLFANVIKAEFRAGWLGRKLSPSRKKGGKKGGNILPILRARMRKESAALRIARGYLEDDATALVEDDVGRPDLHGHGVNGIGFEHAYVGRPVLAVRAVLLVSRVVRRDFAQRRSQPALGQRDGIAGCARVEDFLAIGADVAQGHEDVNVLLRRGRRRAWRDGNVKMGGKVTGDLCLCLERGAGELRQLRLLERTERLVGHLSGAGTAGL